MTVSILLGGRAVGHAKRRIYHRHAGCLPDVRFTLSQPMLHLAALWQNPEQGQSPHHNAWAINQCQVEPYALRAAPARGGAAAEFRNVSWFW